MFGLNTIKAVVDVNYDLGVQCLVSLSDGLAGYTFPLYNTLAVTALHTGHTAPAPEGQVRPLPIRIPTGGTRREAL